MGDVPKIAPPAERLDVGRLQETIVAPMLDIGDVRTDKRIDFVGGARGPRRSERSGDVRPRRGRILDVSRRHRRPDEIADEGGIMPPKSTWFEPKLRDGLLSHVF